MRISDWSSDVCSSDLHIEETTMPATSSDQPLYRIDECSDLMVDACVCGDQGDLIFLSVWARDTAIQQFIGRLTLEIGRASCRERVCQYVSISVVAVPLKTKNNHGPI